MQTSLFMFWIVPLIQVFKFRVDDNHAGTINQAEHPTQGALSEMAWSKIPTTRHPREGGYPLLTAHSRLRGCWKGLKPPTIRTLRHSAKEGVNCEMDPRLREDDGRGGFDFCDEKRTAKRGHPVFPVEKFMGVLFFPRNLWVSYSSLFFLYSSLST